MKPKKQTNITKQKETENKLVVARGERDGVGGWGEIGERLSVCASVRARVCVNVCVCVCVCFRVISNGLCLR